MECANEDCTIMKGDYLATTGIQGNIRMDRKVKAEGEGRGRDLDFRSTTSGSCEYTGRGFPALPLGDALKENRHEMPPEKLNR